MGCFVYACVFVGGFDDDDDDDNYIYRGRGGCFWMVTLKSEVVVDVLGSTAVGEGEDFRFHCCQYIFNSDDLLHLL